MENEVVKGLHEILDKDEDELRVLVKAKDDKGEYLKGREVRAKDGRLTRRRWKRSKRSAKA